MTGRVRGRLARVPTAAWGCAFAALLVATAWSAITPPLHVPDETAHLSYTQHFAETGDIPGDAGRNVFSDEHGRLIDALLFGTTVGRRENGSIWHDVQDRSVDAVEDSPLARDNAGGVQSNSNQPPLYYALTVPAYAASPSEGLLERIALIRLVSALLAAVTTLFVFMFLRELFAEPWTWTVGALAVAFQPMFGFLSGGITPDTLLITASAGLFFGVARAFRAGLTPSRGAGIGAALAVGALAKLNFIALVPGVLLGLALLVWRSPRRLAALPAAATSVGILFVAGLGYVLLNLLVWDRPAWGGGETTATTNVAGAEGVPKLDLRSQIGYTWQLYLPRLPFMADQFGYSPPYTTWFKGWIGLFGWLDTPFPQWAYDVALGIMIPIVALALVGLWQRRHGLAGRWLELLTYAAIVGGLLAAIGFSGIRYRADSGQVFEQARYLLPLLPLYAAAVVLAALGAGRRLARPVGALLVVLAIGHTLFAQLLVIARFYA